jgi:hypothetical protein
MPKSDITPIDIASRDLDRALDKLPGNLGPIVDKMANECIAEIVRQLNMPFNCTTNTIAAHVAFAISVKLYAHLDAWQHRKAANDNQDS